MLTDDEKTHIREEKTYRHEVRASLQAPLSRIQRVLAFLSDRFILWLLSAVVFAGVPFGYATYTEYLKERSEHLNWIEQFERELIIRLDRIRIAAGRARIELEEMLKSEGSAQAIEPVSLSEPRGGMFRDFQDVDLLALTSAYRLLCPQAGNEGEQLYSLVTEVSKAFERPASETRVATLERIVEEMRPLVIKIASECRGDE